MIRNSTTFATDSDMDVTCCVAMLWATVAGALSVVIEPWIPFAWGAYVFGYCLFTCLGGSLVVLAAFWFMRLVGHTVL